MISKDLPPKIKKVFLTIIKRKEGLIPAGVAGKGGLSPLLGSRREKERWELCLGAFFRIVA